MFYLLFQIVATVIFCCMVYVVLGKNIKDFIVKKFNSKKTGSTDEEVLKPSIAINLVKDIMSVTALRDKLAEEKCPEGVKACTRLLTVIVEHGTPKESASKVESVEYSTSTVK